MKMRHVCPPLLTKALVDAGGLATVRQTALNFLVQDESRILYYEDRIKSMPVPVFKRHGVVSGDSDLITLSVGKLTFEQKAHLKMLRERRLQEFVKKRGLVSGIIECSIPNPFQTVSGTRFSWNPAEDVPYVEQPRMGVPLMLTT
jgi:hypothetical protein